MKNNTNLTEPKSLTRCGLWSLHKGNLIAWATGRCLLEHLGTDEVAKLTKDQLVEECLGAILRAEVAEEHRAAATDTVARPVAEIIG
jgi:hypothetical protein